MSKKWKRETVEQFIICVQQHPCLFNIQSTGYFDRVMKAQAWNNILKKMIKSDSSLSSHEIKRKWRNLRVQFMQEQRLININNSKKSGVERPDVYVPKLWCYDQLCFLKTHVEERTSKDNIKTTRKTNTVCGAVDNLSQETHKKKRKNEINNFHNDLNNLKNILIGKKEKKFAWLGNLVATQMEEVRPEYQTYAAWQVQCLMRRLTSKPSRNNISASSSKGILNRSIEELFDDEDFSNSE